MCHPIILASQWPTKCRMKRHLEFENNAVGHTTFCGRLTCQPVLHYMYDGHYSCVF